MTNGEWTDATITRLRQLWAEGHSTAEIGRRLGVSKNAVVGKAHRLDLPARKSPIRQAGAGNPRRPARQPLPKLTDIMPVRSLATSTSPDPIPARVTVPLVAATEPAPIRLGKAPCCWPIGEPGTATFRFYEALVVAGRPYCEEHCKNAYRAPRALPAEAIA
jgi:GcrA cell cycle regulator